MFKDIKGNWIAQVASCCCWWPHLSILFRQLLVWMVGRRYSNKHLFHVTRLSRNSGLSRNSDYWTLHTTGRYTNVGYLKQERGLRGLRGLHNDIVPFEFGVYFPIDEHEHGPKAKVFRDKPPRTSRTPHWIGEWSAFVRYFLTSVYNVQKPTGGYSSSNDGRPPMHLPSYWSGHRSALVHDN